MPVFARSTRYTHRLHVDDEILVYFESARKYNTNELRVARFMADDLRFPRT